MATAHIGSSGFFYPEWSGPFYPPFLSQRQWFNYYAERLAALEISATFYRMPSKELFGRWYKETPDDYAFTMKGPRFITHVKKLKDVESPLEAFFNAAMPLQHKLRAVLWQFPPTFKADLARLEAFFEQLRPFSQRHAFEFRHESWNTRACAALCKANGVALCSADFPDFGDSFPVTTDFVYLRRHGHNGSYAGSYDSEQLAADAERIRAFLGRGLEVFCFFNNNADGSAPNNAVELRRIIAGNNGK